MTSLFAPSREPPPQLPNALAPRAFWVRAPVLLAGAYPGDRHSSVRAQKAAALRHVGVTTVISLMEEDELDHSGRPFDPYAPALAAFGMTVHRHAIRDVSTPSVELVTTILDDIDDSVRGGDVVYVHCWGGRGRTGVIIGCWMVRHAGSRRRTRWRR